MVACWFVVAGSWLPVRGCRFVVAGSWSLGAEGSLINFRDKEEAGEIEMLETIVSEGFFSLKQRQQMLSYLRAVQEVALKRHGG